MVTEITQKTLDEQEKIKHQLINSFHNNVQREKQLGSQRKLYLIIYRLQIQPNELPPVWQMDVTESEKRINKLKLHFTSIKATYNVFELNVPYYLTINP